MSQESDLAQQGYEYFHGKKSQEILTDDIDWPPPHELIAEFEDAAGKLPKHLSALGELIRLEYEDEESLEDEMIYFEDFDELPILASDFMEQHKGKESLFIVGGDYEIEPKDNLICGPLIWVEYQSIKSFDEFEPTYYKHRFAEPFPILCSNKEGTQLYIFRNESEFCIDRSGDVSGGIEG